MSRKIGVSKKNLSRLIKNLEDEKLLEKKKCGHDLRSDVLIITTLGHNHLKEIIPGYFKLINRYFSQFSKHDSILFVKMLNGVSFE